MGNIVSIRKKEFADNLKLKTKQQLEGNDFGYMSKRSGVSKKAIYAKEEARIIKQTKNMRIQKREKPNAAHNKINIFLRTIFSGMDNLSKNSIISLYARKGMNVLGRNNAEKIIEIEKTKRNILITMDDIRFELNQHKLRKRKDRKQKKGSKIHGLRTPKDVNSDEFLSSYAWRKIRYSALQKHGRACQCCGASPGNGTILNVDHIKPRRKYPELALDIDNLQILCDSCNHGKGNWDETDFRK